MRSGQLLQFIRSYSIYIVAIMAMIIYAIRQFILNRRLINKQKQIFSHADILEVEVIDLNDIANKDWLFKLRDENNNIYFIMDRTFYEDRELKFPITRQHLDVFLPGIVVDVASVKIDGANIVIKVFGFKVNSSDQQ